jgi:hypothetical protein
MARKQTFSTSPEKPNPLVGRALTDKIKELAHLSKRQTAMVSDRPKPCGQQATAIGCGYCTIAPSGQQRANLGGTHTRAMKGKPGDEFEIQLGYKHIRLKAIEPSWYVRPNRRRS